MDQNTLLAFHGLPGEQSGSAIKGKIRLGAFELVEVVGNSCIHVILLSICR